MGFENARGEVREVVVYKTVMPECLPDNFLQAVKRDCC